MPNRFSSPVPFEGVYGTFDMSDPTNALDRVVKLDIGGDFGRASGKVDVLISPGLRDATPGF